MLSMRNLPARAARAARRPAHSQRVRSISITPQRPPRARSPHLAPSKPRKRLRPALVPRTPQPQSQCRAYASKSSADALIEEIQEQYATARDEFEIATEETEKKSVYAAEDREAARQELDNLKGLFERALQGEDAEEVSRRVGQRIRELDSAVQALEKIALEE